MLLTRSDAVKHMEPDYFARLTAGGILAGKFVFGEIIADRWTFDRDLSPYLKATQMSFYDFPLRRTLQEAFSYHGQLSSLNGGQMVWDKRALEWNRAVTFIMNHDIPNNEGFRSFILDPVDEELAYVFLLGRSQGVPYVYSDLGTKGGAGLRDDRWDHAHRKAALEKMIRFHNYVHGTSEDLRWADACTLLMRRGTRGFFAINKCAESRRLTVPLEFEGQDLYELKRDVWESLDQAVTVPARSYRLFIKTP